MPAFLRYILPLSYVFGTRLNDARTIGAAAFMEWAPNLLLIWYFTDLPLWQVPLAFGLGWAAFAMVYELGYMMNDLYSVRFEDDPRRRSDAQPGAVGAFAWVAVRLGLFGALAWWFEWYELTHWWALFGVLAVVYLAHNLLRSSAPKVLTFIGLATVRFLAPMAPFLDADELALVLFPAFTHYVLFRTLSYIDSKGMLDMPERTTMRFRLQFYAGVGLLSVIAAAITASWVPLAFSAYYLGFLLVAVVVRWALRRGN
ncbi:MAG: hypothetical protein ACOCV2_13795 [Persicimonas sp.]